MLPALFIHEMSHFAGANEAEAVAVQYLASFLAGQRWLDISMNTKLVVLETVLTAQIRLNSVIQSLNSTPTEFCYVFGETVHGVVELVNEVFNLSQTGGSLVRPYKEMKRVESVMTLMAAGGGYCVNSSNARRQYDESFREKSGGSLQDYVDANGFLVSYTSFTDAKALLQNLSSAQEAIAVTVMNVRKSSLPGDCSVTTSEKGEQEVVCSDN